MVNNVYVSAVTTDNISRHELLAWVNDTLQSSLSKIEEMSTGAAYCQLTDVLFGSAIQLKKVKWNSRNEVDWINNWKILQTSWKNIGVDKPVPVERLMRAKFQENFEFLQWFKKFFDANIQDVEYDAVAARGGEAFPAGSKAPAARPAPRAAPAAAPARKPAPAAAAPRAAVTTTRPSPARTAAAAPPSKSAAPPPAGPAVDAALIKQMEDKVEAYTEECQRAQGERDFYYAKLVAVENLCNTLPDSLTTADQLKSAVLAILYETENGEEEGEVATASEEELAHENGVQNGDVLPAGDAPPEQPKQPAAPAAAPAMTADQFLEDDDDETF